MADLNMRPHPNAREQAPVLPLQFFPGLAPTPDQLYRQISPAVNFNLFRVSIRYEKNTYGYFNSAFKLPFQKCLQGSGVAFDSPERSSRLANYYY
jgi:hypothetical protein